jgi:hypothetical protein
VTVDSVVPPGLWVDDSDEDDERLDRAAYEHDKRLLQVELLNSSTG